jgi:hypothetical protein
MFVKTLLAYYGLDGEGEIITVGNPHKVGEPFTVEFVTRLNNFTTFMSKGRLEIPPGLTMTSIASTEALIGPESRKTSLSVGATKIRENVEINIPPAVKIISIPPSVEFTNAVGSFYVKAELKNGSLSYQRELVFKMDTIEPAEYPLLRDLIKKVTESSSLWVDYSGDASLLRAKSKEMRNLAKAAPAKDPNLDIGVPKKLTAADIRRMEKSLTIQPEDVDTRLSLIWHYSTFDYRNSVQSQEASVRHRIWLIEHHPEIDDSRLFGFSRQEFSTASIEALKKAWIAKVSENGSDTIRMNAIDSLRSYAPAAAFAVAEEGAKLNPENFTFLLMIVNLNADNDSIKGTKEDADQAARKVLDYGTRALMLLKKERSDERDQYRSELLKDLCRSAIRVGDLDRASSFAQELVLDFGQTSYARTYDQAAHIGNTTLGLVELRRSNVAKAKEHLMASIRAPLRMGYNNLGRIDMSLAKEIFEKGEKDAVLEYLKLCLTVPNFKIYPESYADEMYALKLWIEQIAKGTTPNFDFKAAESRLPLPKGVIRPDAKFKIKAQE